MTILIVTHHIEGGTGTYLCELLKLKSKIKKLNIKIALLKQSSFIIIHKDFRKYRSEYISNEINRYNYIFGILAVILFPRELFSLYALVKKIHPSIILSIDFHCGILAACLKYIFLKKISIIVTIHNNIDTVLSKKHCYFVTPFNILALYSLRKLINSLGLLIAYLKTFAIFFL